MNATQLFFQFLYQLQHFSGYCTASHLVSGMQSSGYGTDTHNPPVYATMYGGSCLQSALLVFQHAASYFTFWAS